MFFDIAPSELLIVAVAAIVLIGPKDLPRVMRVVGQWIGKGRAMMRHVHGAVDEMIRESELQETAQRWQAENARIIAEHPVDATKASPDSSAATDRTVLAPAEG